MLGEIWFLDSEGNKYRIPSIFLACRILHHVMQYMIWYDMIWYYVTIEYHQYIGDYWCITRWCFDPLGLLFYSVTNKGTDWSNRLSTLGTYLQFRWSVILRFQNHLLFELRVATTSTAGSALSTSHHSAKVRCRPWGDLRLWRSLLSFVQSRVVIASHEIMILGWWCWFLGDQRWEIIKWSKIHSPNCLQS